MSIQQLKWFLYRRILFCAYHKIKTIKEFEEITRGIREKS